MLRMEKQIKRMYVRINSKTISYSNIIRTCTSMNVHTDFSRTTHKQWTIEDAPRECVREFDQRRRLETRVIMYKRDRDTRTYTVKKIYISRCWKQIRVHICMLRVTCDVGVMSWVTEVFNSQQCARTIRATEASETQTAIYLHNDWWVDPCSSTRRANPGCYFILGPQG